MRRLGRSLLISTALALLSVEAVRAQSSPGWSFGFTPTAAQWNAEFASKQDFTPGLLPLNINGGTMLGPLTTVASTSGGAGFTIPPGVAPSAPNNGDMWTTAAGIFVQVNGATAQLSVGTGGIGSFFGTNNIWTGTNQWNNDAIYNGFSYFAFSCNGSAPVTTYAGGLSVCYNQGGNSEADLWSTNTSAAVSFVFKQMTGVGTFKNLVDFSLGTTSGGILDIYGFTSGKISLLTGSAAAGTWNWVWPLTAGNTGQVLASAGGTGPMTWSNAGAGTVTSATIVAGPGAAVSGTCTITSSGACKVSTSDPPGGRLTLASGVPVMTTSVTSGTLYLVPYQGNTVPVNNGVTLANTQFTASNTDAVGLTLSLNQSGSWAANTLYDVFATLSGTALVLCTGPAWSSSTARATLGSLANFQGILTNSSGTAMTCRTGSTTTISVTQYQATYLGTLATDAAVAGQVSFTLGGTASGGSGAFLDLYNYYNRVSVQATVTDTGASYTYTSATIRAARASNTNRITFVSGAAEDVIASSKNSQTRTTIATTANTQIGIGLNSTSVFAIQPSLGTNPANVTTPTFVLVNNYTAPPQLGLGFLQSLEQGDGTDANTFDNNSLDVLQATLRM